MVPCRLEPQTLRLLAIHSDQLSYETSCMGKVSVVFSVRSVRRDWGWSVFSGVKLASCCGERKALTVLANRSLGHHWSTR